MSVNPISDTMNPFVPDQIKPDGIITRADIQGIHAAIGAAVASTQRVLSQSAGQFRPDDPTAWEWAYLFDIRKPSTDRMPTLRIWTQGADVEFYQVVGGSLTLIDSDNSGGNTTVKLMTFSVDMTSWAMGSDREVSIAIRCRGYAGSGSAFGYIYGFTLTEEGESDPLLYQHEGMPSSFIHEERLNPNFYYPLDLALARRTCKLVEEMMVFTQRGSSLAWPMNAAPPMSSIHWRALGPFPWLTAPWCSNVKVMIRHGLPTGSRVADDYVGRYSVSAFSGAQRVGVRSQSDVDRVMIGNGVDSFDMGNPLLDQTILTIPARAGAWNNIFVAFIGDYFDTPFQFEYELTNTRFDDYAQGIIKTSVNAAFPATVSAFEDAQCKLGHHIQLRSENNAWINTADGGKPNSNFSSIVRTVDDPKANSVNTDTEYLFDVVNIKGAHDSEYYASISPSPSFVLPSNPNDENLKIQINRHGWARLYSLWISDSFEESDQYRFNRPNRPASSSLIGDNYGVLLNALMNHPRMVYGFGHAHEGVFFGNKPLGVKVRGTFYPTINAVSDVYEYPTDLIPNLGVLNFPYFVERDPTGDRRRTATTATLKLQFAIFRLAEEDGQSSDPRIPQPAVKLRVRAVWRTEPYLLSAFSGGAIRTEDWVEIDVQDMVRPNADVDTQSLWDAYTNSAKAGWDADDPSGFARNTPTGCWVPEILAEEYPWDQTDVEVDVSGPLLDEDIAYGSPYWLTFDVDFHSYQKLGSGASGTNSAGNGRYMLVITGSALIANEYPLETR